MKRKHSWCHPNWSFPTSTFHVLLINLFGEKGEDGLPTPLFIVISQVDQLRPQALARVPGPAVWRVSGWLPSLSARLWTSSCSLGREAPWLPRATRADPRTHMAPGTGRQRESPAANPWQVRLADK